MSGFEDVLLRAQRDSTFRDLLTDDPTAALAGYGLSNDELSTLSDYLSAAVQGADERTRRARFFRLFAERRRGSNPARSRGG